MSNAIRISLIALPLLAGAVWAQEGTPASGQQVEQEPARVTARDRQARQPAAALDFRAEPTRESYKVEEPIQFRVRGDRRFFLYVVAIDEDTGQATLLVPGKAQSGNQYDPGRDYVVPNPNLEFVSDRPGNERIIMIASTRWINPDLSRFTGSGAFGVAPMAAFEGAFEAAGVTVRRRESARDRQAPPSDVVVREFNVRIEGDATAAPPAAEQAFPFVALDRREYVSGDALRIAFGASENGYVHLFMVHGDGRPEPLTSREVEKGRSYELRGRAVAPFGAQSIVAAYSTEATMDVDAIAPAAMRPATLDPAGGVQAMGIRLDSEEKAPTARFDFSVRERR